MKADKYYTVIDARCPPSGLVKDDVILHSKRSDEPVVVEDVHGPYFGGYTIYWHKDIPGGLTSGCMIADIGDTFVVVRMES